MERIGAFMVKHPWLVTLPLAGLAALAVGVGAYNYFEVRDTATRVTRIEASPCQRDPQSHECAALRRSILLNEPIANSCISFRRIVRPRAVFKKFTRCGDYRRAHESTRSRRSIQGGANDGDSNTTGTTPGSRSTGGSVPPSDGGSSGGSSGDGGDQPAPQTPSPPEPPTTPPPPPQNPPNTQPPAHQPSVGGTGIDLPAVDECNTVVVSSLCS